MPKKRRKLNKEFESKISAASRKVELMLAKINDIYDEDIQGEYRVAFDPIRALSGLLVKLYKDVGYNEEIQAFYDQYTRLLSAFQEEYEI